MANKDMPYGLRAAKHLSGSPWNGQTMKCWGSSTYTTALYIGDPVIYDGDSCDRGCCPHVVLLTTGQAAEMVGAIASIAETHSVSLGRADIIHDGVHRLASTSRFLNVVVDPDVIFMIQGDSTAAITIADVGSNMELIDTAHTAAAARGLSCWEILGGAAVQDKTEQTWLMGAVDRDDNDISLVNADWYVLLNTHIIGYSGSGAKGRALGI